MQNLKQKMRSIIKSIIIKSAKIYKPIDLRLRTNATYRSLSNYARDKFRKIVNPSLKASRTYLSKVQANAVNPNLVLLESYWGKQVSCHPYAIYLALNRLSDRKNLYFVWVIRPSTIMPKDVTENHRVSFVMHGSDEYLFSLATAGYLINNLTFPAYFMIRDEQRYMNTWHGTPLKTLGLDADPNLMASANTQRNYIQASHILTSGPFSTEKTVYSYGARTLTQSKVREIGSPRVDLTLGADTAQIGLSLGLHKGKKTLLYAPTWRGKPGAVRHEINDQIALLHRLHEALSDDYDIIVSVHHLIQSSVKSLSSQFRFIPEDININEVLSVCDILISDYSSIIFDFMVLDRPIILITEDRDEYETERGLYIQLEDLPVTLIADSEKLAQAIPSAPPPSSFECFHTVRTAFLPHDDGRASERAVELLLSPQPNAVSTRKRILFAPGDLQPNGISSAFINLLGSIDFDRFDVCVMIDAKRLDDNPSRRRYLEKIPVHCHLILKCGQILQTAREELVYRKVQNGSETLEMDNTINQMFSREQRRVLGFNKFDYAIDYSGYSPYWSLFIAHTQSERKVIYQHNDMAAELANRQKAHEQLLSVFHAYQFFDVVAAVSVGLQHKNAVSLKNFYRAGVGPVSAPNLINASEIRSLAAEPITSDNVMRLMQQETSTRFVNIARLSPEKNQLLLLRAFSKALKAGAKAALVIVGDGPLLGKLMAERTKLGLEKHVVFAGYQPNPFPILAACDCLILPSQYEGQGLVLLEAMTLNVPCIGSATPAIRSVIEAYGGRLVEPDEVSIVNAIMAFVKNPAGIKAAFDAEQYQAHALSKFYREVLSLSVDNALPRQK